MALRRSLGVAAWIGLASVTLVAAQTGTDNNVTPLINQRWPWPYSGPEKIDTSNTARGIQTGSNLCNSTTQNQNSMCINAVVNDATDFCIFAPPQPNSTIADTEGEEVAWCTKSGYGTRIIPQGALQGLQAIRTPGYLEIIGAIDQTAVNIAAGDTGGELDPHGADNRGNPIGSLMYSTAFSSTKAFQQVIEWNIFLGGNIFCLKVCDPASADQNQLCLNTYDRIGCAYNMPANYAALNSTFSSCLGDNQLPVGVYVVNGVTSTYQQPAESLGAITSIPYTASVPASSSCTPFSSAQVYTAAASLAPSSSSTTSSSSSSTTSAASTSGGSSRGSSSSAGPTSTSSPSGASPAFNFPRSQAAALLGLGALVGAFLL